VLLLGILVYFGDMSTEPPDGSVFVGYRCTNKDCLRIFSSENSIRLHKFHRSNRGTPCSNKKNEDRVFEVPEMRKALTSLQSSRMLSVVSCIYEFWFEKHETVETQKNTQNAFLTLKLVAFF
jgi:hypothetical protein